MVVSNSSPLIYLAELNEFDLLRVLFDEIAIPNAVFQEVVVAGVQYPVAREVLAAEDKWIHVWATENLEQVKSLQDSGLDRGESEAIALSQQVQAESLLLDDAAAIQSATRVTLNVIRTPGIFRLAKQKGLIPTIRPKLEALRKAGFWLREEHFRIILESAGEPSE